jgi:hypothetical protein
LDIISVIVSDKQIRLLLKLDSSFLKNADFFVNKKIATIKSYIYCLRLFRHSFGDKYSLSKDHIPRLAFLALASAFTLWFVYSTCSFRGRLILAIHSETVKKIQKWWL